MKPEIQITNLNIEKQSVDLGSSVENVSRLDQENTAKNETEHYGQKTELNARVSDVGTTTILPTPVKNVNIVDKNTIINDTTTIVNSPIIANDDDLIEKEWVDRAKKIVSETRDDPHKQEEAVSKLQVDYLKKRYGREIGVAE